MVGGVAAAIWNLSVLNRVYGVPWTSMLGVRRSDIVLMVDTAKRLIRRSQPQRDPEYAAADSGRSSTDSTFGGTGAVMLLCFVVSSRGLMNDRLDQLVASLSAQTRSALRGRRLRSERRGERDGARAAMVRHCSAVRLPVAPRALRREECGGGSRPW